MKTKLLIKLIIIFGAAFSLIACSGESDEPAPNNSAQVVVDPITNSEEAVAIQVDPPAVAPAEAGKASVTGSVFSLTYNQPIVGIPISLSEIVRDENGDGVYVYDPAFSPITESVPGGYFVFDNIDPGEYVLVVGNVEINTYEIITDDEGLPMIFNAPAEQITEIPVVEVEGLDIYVTGPTNQDGYPAPEGYPEPASDS